MPDDEELLATMSHELRTPLNAILGWVQLLRAGDACSPEAERALEIIERNARAEARAVDDAIDLARIQSGMVVLVKRETGWAEDVRAAAATYEHAAQERGVRLAVTIEHEVRLIADPARLGQIVRGLIASAVRRTQPGGVVRVKLARAGGDAVLSVHEEREGEEVTADRRRIARISDGRGLSVLVARGLVRMHGGTVEEQDRGATLVVRIPATTDKKDPKTSAQRRAEAASAGR